MDLLSKIIETKRESLAAARKHRSSDQIRESALAVRRTSTSHSLLKALSNNARVNIIAEFKRRSPSKGIIRGDVTALDMARRYQVGGAAAISVLTEEAHFGGSLDDLHSVKQTVELPILRKDFIIDEYQVLESAAEGADAVLLIVSALDDRALSKLRQLTEDILEMDALVEVHTRDEMRRALASGATMIGINNRDLRTFNVSLDVSLELVKSAPPQTILVAESGLNSASDLLKLRDAGFNGFLIGEFLMKAPHPEEVLRQLVGR